jgi:hypothetical protein
MLPSPCYPFGVSWLQLFKRTHQTSSLGLERMAPGSNALMFLFASFCTTRLAGVSVELRRMPKNIEEVLTNAFLREASIVRDHAVSAALRVNTDQTRLVYHQGAQETWTKSGAKQVSTVGQEEKRAFTLVPSISASGVLLPMQAIFMGKTNASCPSPKTPSYAEAMREGFVMLPSKSSTYWSTHSFSATSSRHTLTRRKLTLDSKRPIPLSGRSTVGQFTNPKSS